MKYFLHITGLILSSCILTACSDSGGDNVNVGWVEITEPTTMNTYTAVDVTTINLAGDTFMSPEAEARESTVCNCAGLACFLSNVYCETRTYYNTGVTVTITNITTGETVENRLISRDGFITHWSVDMSLTPNENVIQVHAEDELGNRGTAQIIIYAVDATPPTVLATIPENNSVVYASSAITVNFSEAMDTSSITTSSFSVSDDVSNVSGTISFGDGNKKATFTPSTNLSYDTTYNVTLNNTLQDLAGNKLTTTTWNFTTLVEIWQFGTSAPDNGFDIAVDEIGNTYVTGSTDGDFTGTGSAGMYDAFIAKHDPSGKPLWIKQFGTAGNDGGRGIAVDSIGNSYVTGYKGGFPFITGSYGVFLAKYDNSGNQLWINQLSTDNSDFGNGVAVDENGNSYITGDTRGDLAGTGNAGSSDLFIAKFDTSGNQLWIKQFGTFTVDEGSDLAIDLNGNSYVTGYTYGEIVGTGSTVGSDVFLAKYDTLGNRLWIKQFSSIENHNEGYGIAVDTNGNSYVTGHTSGDLAGTKNAGGSDTFIVKYNTFGTQIWIKQFGTPYSDIGHNIAVDMNGNSYVTGETRGDLDSPGNAGLSDVFIAKHDTSGNQSWIKQFGTSSFDIGYGIAVDMDGNSYVTGNTAGNLVGIGITGIGVFIAHLPKTSN